MSKLFKFREWENPYHKQILSDQLFFCSSIAKFNDPFDSTIPINYADLTDEEKIKAIERHVSNNYPRAVGPQRTKLIERIFQESAIDDPEQLKKNHEEVVIPKIESEIGILSFAGNKEHILLWSHYSDSHKGFCVGINREKLRKYIRPLIIEENKFLKLYDVTYQEDYPQINPIEITAEEYYSLPLTIKSKVWSYEDEVRLIYKDGANELVKIEKDLFEEVTIGAKICEDHEKEIIDTVNDQFDDLPIYKAELADSSYSLSFKRVS